MRHLLAVLLLAFTVGCGTVGGLTRPVHAPTTIENEAPMAKALRLAHIAIDEANAALTALNVTIGNNAAAGVWTKDQAQGYLDLSKMYGAKVDAAREALRLGNVADATSQAELVKTFILMLHKKVAEEARKGQP